MIWEIDGAERESTGVAHGSIIGQRVNSSCCEDIELKGARNGVADRIRRDCGSYFPGNPQFTINE